MVKAWKDVIVEALQSLGGEAHLSDIYEKVVEDYPEKITSGYEKTIQDCVQRFSSDSKKFNKKEDVFYSVDGLGKGIWGLNKYEDNQNRNLTTDDSGFPEGKKKLAKHIRRERNYKLIRTAKDEFKKREGKLYCQICGFDFECKYGKIGEDFIEGHHIIPVNELVEGSKTRVEDIALLCSNCHSMIHRRRPWLSIEEIGNLLK